MHQQNQRINANLVIMLDALTLLNVFLVPAVVAVIVLIEASISYVVIVIIVAILIPIIRSLVRCNKCGKRSKLSWVLFKSLPLGRCSECKHDFSAVNEN